MWVGGAIVALTCAAAVGTSAAQTASLTPRAGAKPAAVTVANDEFAIANAHVSEHAAAAAEKPSRAATPLKIANPSPSVIGSWAPAIKDKSGVIGISSVLLSTGKVLLWGPHSVAAGGAYEIQTMASLFDPATGKTKRVDPPEDANVFCGGATILGDGTVLAVGGLDPYFGWSSIGNPVVVLFDPITETWSEAPPMIDGRWYPTVTELADGSAVIVGGRNKLHKPNYNVEHIGPLPSTTPQVVAQYKLDYQQGLYPNQFLLPTGQVFTFAGNRTDYLDPSTWRINKGPVPLAPQFNYPNAVVLPITPGGHIQMVVYGGKNKFAGTTTSVSSKIDLSAATPTFTALRPMPQPRTNMNSVLLPDGTILVVGGNQVDQFTTPTLQSLLYNPANDTWTPLASQTLRRGYHSTAILLADGRVLSAGDNGPVPGGRNNLEIYSPPYMFQGTRPAITAAPATARFKRSAGTKITKSTAVNISVKTNVAVSKAVLISPGATTHATNMHQRMVELASVPLASGTGLTATIPADGTVPPGPYMLFVLDSNNTPSVASWVMVS